MKILKTYTGFSSGSYMGRDDGYPETKRVVFDLSTTDGSERFLNDYGKDRDEKYFLLQEMSVSEVQEKVSEFRNQKEMEQRKRHLKEILAEKENLIARLKEIEEEGF